MIGRASIGYPWIFNEIKHFLATGEHLPAPAVADRVQACRQHLDFSVRWKGERTGIFEMRRHYTNYFRGLENFKPFRSRLVDAPSHAGISEILEEITEAYEEAVLND